MLRIGLFASVACLSVALIVGIAHSHCEIPCGIYHDQMRIQLLNEHVATIEKSITQIEALSGKGDPLTVNQIVRWVNNKEDHANKIQEIVTQYFMTQRVKPKMPTEGEAYDKYVTQATSLQQMLVYAMKCKQTVDKQNTGRLKALIAQFSLAYFSKEDLEHMRQHKH